MRRSASFARIFKSRNAIGGHFWSPHPVRALSGARLGVIWPRMSMGRHHGGAQRSSLGCCLVAAVFFFFAPLVKRPPEGEGWAFWPSTLPGAAWRPFRVDRFFILCTPTKQVFHRSFGGRGARCLPPFFVARIKRGKCLSPMTGNGDNGNGNSAPAGRGVMRGKREVRQILWTKPQAVTNKAGEESLFLNLFRIKFCEAECDYFGSSQFQQGFCLLLGSPVIISPFFFSSCLLSKIFHSFLQARTSLFGLGFLYINAKN